MSSKGTSVQLFDILFRIQDAVFKYGIRTRDFFTDYDPHRCGQVERNKFISAISLCCGKKAGLTAKEMAALADFYSTGDGRVFYKQFCDITENAQRTMSIEQSSQGTSARPSQETPLYDSSHLSPTEEAVLSDTLHRLEQFVVERRLNALMYFQDFDRSDAYTRRISATQFSRVIVSLNLPVSHQEVELLAKKFQSEGTGDVDYFAFVKAIDAEYQGVFVRPSLGRPSMKGPSTSMEGGVDISFDAVLEKIRDHVLRSRIRVEEYFKDFDPLHSGKISISRFRSGLSLLSLHLVNEREFQVLASHYCDASSADLVSWMRFVLDVEIVFTKRGLERTPLEELPESADFLIQKNLPSKRTLSQDESRRLEQLLNDIKRRVATTGRSARPVLQSFDRLNRKIVLKHQFARAMATAGIFLSHQDITLLEKAFSLDDSVCYWDFLELIEPVNHTRWLYPEMLNEIKLLNERRTASINNIF